MVVMAGNKSRRVASASLKILSLKSFVSLFSLGNHKYNEKKKINILQNT